jgi:hypothetical protein
LRSNVLFLFVDSSSLATQMRRSAGRFRPTLPREMAAFRAVSYGGTTNIEDAQKVALDVVRLRAGLVRALRGKGKATI